MTSGSRRLSDEEEAHIRRELTELRQEHRDLDAAISAMVESGRMDTIRIQRLKKRKLALKDRISVLQHQRPAYIIACPSRRRRCRSSGGAALPHYNRRPL